MSYEDRFKAVDRLYRAGEIDQARALLQHIKTKAESEDNVVILVKTWQCLIVFYQDQGQLDEALTVANYALENLKRLKQQSSADYCDILKRRGFVYYLKGDVARFLSDVDEALAIAEENHPELAIAGCVGVLGIYYQDTGPHDLNQALDCISRALEIQNRIGERESAVKLMINLGALRRARKEFAESLQVLRVALNVAQSLKLTRPIINCHLEIGKLFLAQDNLAMAKRKLNLALKLSESTNFANEKGDCYRELARVAAQRGAKKASQAFYQKALAIWQGYGYQQKATAVAKEMKK